MSVESKPMYWAVCDYPACERATSDFEGGNHAVYDSEAKLKTAFERFEGGLTDDYGWLRLEDGRHFCGEHTTWNDEGDELVPRSPDFGTST